MGQFINLQSADGFSFPAYVAEPSGKAKGGLVVAEAEESAVIFGMPKEAIGTGCVDKVLPLSGILEQIRRFGREAAPELGGGAPGA